MREKAQILKESLDRMDKFPDWDGTASLHERLTIEVLIDIRDILKQWIPTPNDKTSGGKKGG